jgi:hypothetical protein
MNKKTTLILIIVVLVVVAIGGGYWAWQRYEEQRVAQQFLSGIAALSGKNVNVSDLQKLAEEAKNFPGGGGETGGEEAAETPEQKFNSTEEVQVDLPFVKSAGDEVAPIIKEVFGGAKLSSFLNNYFGEGTGMVQFMIPREAVSGDLNKLNSAFTSHGYVVVMSGIESNGGSLTVTKDNKQYMLTFDIGGQDVTVIVLSEATQ